MEPTDSLRDRDLATTPEPDEEQAVERELTDEPGTASEFTAEQAHARGLFNDLLAAPPVPTVSRPPAVVPGLRAESDSLTELASDSEPASATAVGELDSAGDAPGGVTSNVEVAPVFDFSERPRRVRAHTRWFDWSTLALAFIAPPVGFVASIVVRVLSYRKHGWTSGVTRTATVVSVIMTAVLAVVVTINLNLAAADAAQAARVSASAPLCAELQGIDGEPGVLDQPGFGWPVERTAIPETLSAMKDYQTRWMSFTEIAPSFETASVRAIADAAGTLVNQVETSQTINREGNLAQITTITAQSPLPQWFATYCN
jgi:hypothetical protein